jgi:cupin superfamily acireductone dioxygenase involved in methionine salvage
MPLQSLHSVQFVCALVVDGLLLLALHARPSHSVDERKMSGELFRAPINSAHWFDMGCDFISYPSWPD